MVSGSLRKVACEVFEHPLSVMLFIRGPGQRSSAPSAPGGQGPLVPGLADGLFTHSGNMITKAEVRAVAISRLGLSPCGVFWDIGSCTGSVAIEAARLMPGGRVFAVEREARRVEDMRENVARFGLTNVSVVHGEAPACLRGLAAPDSVFIGGGGRAVASILGRVFRRVRPGGVVMVSAVTVETAARAIEFFRGRGVERDVLHLNISQGRDLAGLTMLSASNPVFLIRGVRP